MALSRAHTSAEAADPANVAEYLSVPPNRNRSHNQALTLM